MPHLQEREFVPKLEPAMVTSPASLPELLLSSSSASRWRYSPHHTPWDDAGNTPGGPLHQAPSKPMLFRGRNPGGGDREGGGAGRTTAPGLGKPRFLS